jgi:hypothetical protein
MICLCLVRGDFSLCLFSTSQFVVAEQRTHSCTIARIVSCVPLEASDGLELVPVSPSTRSQPTDERP